MHIIGNWCRSWSWKRGNHLFSPTGEKVVSPKRQVLEDSFHLKCSQAGCAGVLPQNKLFLSKHLSNTRKWTKQLLFFFEIIDGLWTRKLAEKVCWEAFLDRENWFVSTDSWKNSLRRIAQCWWIVTRSSNTDMVLWLSLYFCLVLNSNGTWVQW